MNCKDIKIIYNDLTKARGKLSNKKSWLDKRITEIASPELIIKLTNEGLALDSKARHIYKKISQLEGQYRFLKHTGANNV